MNFTAIKAQLTDWYNRKIVAKWYRSTAIIGGWLVSAIAFLPDLLQWAVVDHFDLFAGIVLPTLSPMAKAALLSFYVTFIAPPLRAWVQESMQAASIKQLAEADKVIPLPASGVAPPSTQNPSEKSAADLTDAELMDELSNRARARARMAQDIIGPGPL